MVVDDFDIVGMTAAPHKGYSPLRIDAQRVLTSPIAAQGFKSIPWRQPQIVKFDRLVE